MQNEPRVIAKAAVVWCVVRSILIAASVWLSRVDQGAHRRIKGLRLVTAYGIAAMLGTMPDIVAGLPDGSALSSLAGGFALWGSVSEAQSTRAESSRDLLLLTIAAALGAAIFIVSAPSLRRIGFVGPEIVLASGAFCVGYLRRFGITGTGVGSQIYIGQLLAYSAGLGPQDLPIVVVAAVLATIASIVPRVLSDPAEHPPPTSTLPPRAGRIPPELAMGLQASVAAIVIVALNAAVGLAEFSMGHHRQHLCRGRLRVSYDRPGETSDCWHRDGRPDRSGVPAAHDDRAGDGMGSGGVGNGDVRNGIA